MRYPTINETRSRIFHTEKITSHRFPSFLREQDRLSARVWRTIVLTNSSQDFTGPSPTAQKHLYPFVPSMESRENTQGKRAMPSGSQNNNRKPSKRQVE